VELPIAEAVYRVAYEGLDPLKALSELMSREPKAEG
jgi:glycerol-3-phosphate dehydrogenase (NAD(P)+)